MKVQKFHVSADFNKVSINEGIANKLTLSEDLDDNIFSMMDAFDDTYHPSDDADGLHPSIPQKADDIVPDKIETEIEYDDDFVDGEGVPSNAPIQKEEDKIPGGPKTVPETGLAASLMHAINGEYNTITEYNDIIVFLKSLGRDDFINVINDINAEEQKHVGQLQEILNTISDSAKEVAKGAEEAKEQLNEVDLNLTKEDTELLANLTMPDMRAETIAGIVAKLPDEIIPTLADSIKDELKDIPVSDEARVEIETGSGINSFNNIPELVDILKTKDVLTIRTGLILLLQKIDENSKVDSLLKATLVALSKINNDEAKEVEEAQNILTTEVSNESN